MVWSQSDRQRLSETISGEWRTHAVALYFSLPVIGLTWSQSVRQELRETISEEWRTHAVLFVAGDLLAVELPYAHKGQ